MSDKKIRKEYKNDEITVTWEPDKCIHSKICWQELGKVFKPMKRPWVQLDGSENEEIVKQIEKCPSGALGYYYNNEKQNEENEQNETNMMEIKVNKNGSLKVTGPVKVVMPDGSEQIKEGKFSICRCGLSEKKPFCDGSHKETNFDSNWDIETV